MQQSRYVFQLEKKGFKTLGAQWGVSKGVYSRQPFCASKALQGSRTFATAVDSHQIVPSVVLNLPHAGTL